VTAPRGGKKTGSESANGWSHLHLWQIQPLRDVLVIAAVFGILWLGYKISLVTVPMLLALMLAYLFEPVVVWATGRFKWMTRRMAAGGLIAAAVIFVVVPLSFATVWGVAEGTRFTVRQADNATHFANVVEATYNGTVTLENIEEHAEYKELSSEVWRWGAKFLAEQKSDELAVRVADFIATVDPVPTMKQVKDYLGGAASRIASSLSLIGVLGFQLFLTAFFFFFFSSGFGKVIEFVRNLLPDKHEDRIVDLAQKMDRVIAGFVRGRLTIAVIQGAIFTVAYFIIGVPGALFLGFAVGFLSIIPYLALIGIPISIALLFLDGPSGGFRSEWWFMLFAPVVVYFIVQALDDYVWTPMIQGKSTGLDTPTVLFASIAGGALAGFYGLLIAIPVAACVKILIQEVLWPRFKEWREGGATDPLPLGGSGGSQE